MKPVDLEAFQRHRSVLLALAYRMLGEVGRAEEIVQDAWLRWQEHGSDVANPRAFLIRMVSRLCLNELESARARKEEARGDRLPEPMSLEDAGIARVEDLDNISMAFVVLLQRLTPAERAVLLLHEVFDFGHGEIATLLGRTESACRQLLKRARERVAAERRSLTVSPETHRRLLRAFLARRRPAISESSRSYWLMMPCSSSTPGQMAARMAASGTCRVPLSVPQKLRRSSPQSHREVLRGWRRANVSSTVSPQLSCFDMGNRLRQFFCLWPATKFPESSCTRMRAAFAMWAGCIDVRQGDWSG